MQVRAVFVHHMASSQIPFWVHRNILCHGIWHLLAVDGHCTYCIGASRDVTCPFCYGSDLKLKRQKVDYFCGKAEQKEVETTADVPISICK